MKMKFILYCLSPFLLVLFVGSTLINPNNPPAGRTGAPGEATCQASGCHSGGSFTGTVSIAGVPDSIVANEIYTLTLTNESDASRAGFQLTCLDGSNLKCGTLASASGVSTANAGGRQYARQSSPKTLSGGKASWSFTWKAPAAITGDTAIFYFVSLAANGNGNDNGDNVLINSKKVVIPTAVVSGSHDTKADSFVKIYPTPAKDFLNVDLSGKKGLFSLHDLQGRQVLEQAVNGQQKVELGHLESGLYLAKVNIGGEIVSKLITVF